MIFTFFGGFVIFLGEVHTASRSVPVRADTIVVFSGDPRRIRAATKLLKEGFGNNLLIVGQDNTEEISKIRLENRSLFICCVTVDNKSRNTAEDAMLASNIIQQKGWKSVLLVTSFFHVPRAKEELSTILPETNIETYGINDEFYKIEDIIFDTKVCSAFLSQYILYVASTLPGSRNILDETSARRSLRAISKWENILLVIIAVSAIIVAAFALSRQKVRRRQYLLKKKRATETIRPRDKG